MKNKIDGITLYICFGCWAGFHFIHDQFEMRLVLGYVSLAVLFFDLEVKLSAVTSRVEVYKNHIKELELTREKHS